MYMLVDRLRVVLLYSQAKAGIVLSQAVAMAIGGGLVGLCIIWKVGVLAYMHLMAHSIYARECLHMWTAR